MNNSLKTEKCPHCGAGMKEYWHNLTPGLISILIKSIKWVNKTNKNKFHYKDLELNYSEASNLQKLRFHGLIAHYDKDNIKSGEWLITKRGGQFLRKEIKVLSKVKTFRNEVMDHGGNLVGLDDFKNKVPEFESNFSFEFKEIDFPKVSTLFTIMETQVVEGPDGQRVARRVQVTKTI